MCERLCNVRSAVFQPAAILEALSKFSPDISDSDSDSDDERSGVGGPFSDDAGKKMAAVGLDSGWPRLGHRFASHKYATERGG